MDDENKPPSKLEFKISPYLRRLAVGSGAVRKQFFPSDEEMQVSEGIGDDPLGEEKSILIKGLVQKYAGRVLVELTWSCAAYCRFCTRRRKVDDCGRDRLVQSDIDKIIEYLDSHQDINEVILSGGDPMYVPDLLIYTLNRLKKLKQIKIVRIHTRVPVSNPKLVNSRVLKALTGLSKKAFYLSVHFEHPDELTKETRRVIGKIKKTGAVLLSQSVFLKGVNDSVTVLKELFSGLIEIGIRPYYIFRCDPVAGAEHFIVPFEKEIEIMTRLRSELSGLACPTYVIDAPGGYGKIPVPLGYWGKVARRFKDYRGNDIEVVGP